MDFVFSPLVILVLVILTLLYIIRWLELLNFLLLHSHTHARVQMLLITFDNLCMLRLMTINLQLNVSNIRFIVHLILAYILLHLLIFYYMALVTLIGLIISIIKSLWVFMLSILIITLSLKRIVSKKIVAWSFMKAKYKAIVDESSPCYMNLVIYPFLVLSCAVIILEQLIS